MRKITQVFVFDILAKVISGLVAVLLIRYLSQSEYASYIFGLSFVSVIVGVLVVTFNRIYIVGFKSLQLENHSDRLLALQILMLAALVVLLAPFVSGMGNIYWAAVPLIFASCVSDFSRSVFQHELSFLRYSLVETLRSLLFTGTLVVLILAHYQLSASLILILQAVIIFLVFLGTFARRVRLTSFIEINHITQLARQIISGPYKYLVGYFAVLAVFSEVDIFFLKWLSNDHQLATYGSAFRYYTIALLALNSIQTVLLPMVQRAETAEQLYHLYRRHFQMLLVLIPGLIIGGWASQWVIPLVDEGKYPAAVLTFQILATSAAVSLIFSPYSSVVLRFEDFKFLLILILAGLGVIAAVNVILIPTYGSVGAAIATLCGFGLLNFGTFLKAEKHRKSMVRSQHEAQSAGT